MVYTYDRILARLPVLVSPHRVSRWGLGLVGIRLRLHIKPYQYPPKAAGSRVD